MITSVIMCTYNRKEQLVHGLNSILSQRMFPDEIVVVDDGSSDGTREWMEKFSQYTKMKESIPDVRYIYLKDHPEPRISCIPRNIGIKAARGDELIFTEPEAIQVGNTIEKLVLAMEEHPENTILASQVYTMGEKIWNLLKDDSDWKDGEKIITHPYAMLVSGNMQNTNAPDSDWAITGESHCNAGVLFATRKEWLIEIGGFNEEFVGHGFDDFDLFNRLALIGHGVLKDPTIAVIHQWHEKGFYPYNIYECAEKNGKISEAMIHAGQYKVNIGDEWGELE